MERKLPYYMAYPMPFLFDEERIERRDYEYMKSLYPDAAKKILPYIEEECDRWEGPGSMIYDEYPDRLQLRMMCRRIYNRIMAEEKALYGTIYGERNLPNQQLYGVEELQFPQGSCRNAPAQSAEARKAIQSQKTAGKDRQVQGMQKEDLGSIQPEQNGWLYDLVEVMLYQELYRRRSAERREKRKFY